MLLECALVIAGLAMLVFCGDMLVRGTVSLATALNIPALLISLTIVAFGTSAPELFVSVQAVMTGNDGISIGNIVGSNIANVFLVLGAPALIYPISTHVIGLRRHAVVMLAATAAFAAAAYLHGSIDTMIGAGLFLGVLLYVAYMWHRALKSPGGEPVLEDIEEFEADSGVTLKTLGFILVGLVGMPLGAHLLVSNGSAIASGLGVREELIGLTIIAFGTSLPELATVIAAAFHKKSDVAIGGIVGSNIFNIFAVGGAAGLAGTARFDPATLRFDLPAMILAALVLAAFVLTRKSIGRLSGLLMTAGYLRFIGLLAANASHG